MRCVFAPLDAAICSACRQRGSQCVSQDFPQDVADDLFHDPGPGSRAYSQCDQSNSTCTPTSASLQTLTPCSGIFRRLFAQVLHYNLLNQLHLPYMLRSSSANRRHEYSLMACVNASREMLSRFITLRNSNGVAYRCRTIDFIALMAAMTLLLAHLDSHGSETESLLAHRYHSDRAMIELAKNMQELNRVRSDALSAQIADWLARLLAIEAEAAEDGQPRCGRTLSVQKAGVETDEGAP
ncbi:unnamed protein product [Discula destructiva]